MRNSTFVSSFILVTLLTCLEIVVDNLVEVELQEVTDAD